MCSSDAWASAQIAATRNLAAWPAGSCCKIRETPAQRRADRHCRVRSPSCAFRVPIMVKPHLTLSRTIALVAWLLTLMPGHLCLCLHACGSDTEGVATHARCGHHGGEDHRYGNHGCDQHAGEHHGCDRPAANHEPDCAESCGSCQSSECPACPMCPVCRGVPKTVLGPLVTADLPALVFSQPYVPAHRAAASTAAESCARFFDTSSDTRRLPLRI